MIATHNIKVNGRWVKAGEEYTLAEKAKAAEKPERKEEKKPEEAPKAEAPAKPASTRRKKISE